MKKLTLMGAAVWLAVSAMAAVTPLARWSGDFNETTKGSFTFDANGNDVASDGSCVTIKAGATRGVTVSYPASVGLVTIAVRYSGLKKNSATAALFTVYGNGTHQSGIGPEEDRAGGALLANGNVGPIWRQKLDETTGTSVAYPAAEEGRLAFCYSPGFSDPGNQRGTFLLSATWDGGWSSLATWLNIGSMDVNNTIGCAIGGPRIDNANLAALPGMVIDEIAVFANRLDAQGLDEALPPSKRPMPQPSLKYAAEDAVTDVSGNVISWPNAGTALSADLAAKGTGITVADNAFGVASSVRFPGGTMDANDAGPYLLATEASSYGLTSTSGATIFEVYSAATPENSGKWGSWGLKTAAGQRCFTDMVNGSIRFLWFVDTAFASGQSVFASRLMTAHIVSSGNPRRLKCFRDGTYLNVAGNNGTVAAGTFCLGWCGHASVAGNLFKGDIAEFRLYSCELTAAERFQVECELAEKYSMTVNPDGASPISPVLLNGHVQEPVVLGTLPESAQGGSGAQGLVLSEGTSGDLTIGFATAPAADAVTLTYVAGNGASAVSERTWAIAGASGARAVPLSLTFTGADYVGLETKSLFCRANAQSQWRRVPVAAEVTETSVSFVLPAGWENARYGVFANVTREIPTLWFRAEDAVTDVDGNVTSLPNVGTLAAEIPELKPTTHQDAGTIVRKTDAAWFGGKPYLHIVNSHLLSDGTTDLGLSDPVKGVAWFVVYRRLGGDGSKHGALFGFGSTDNSLRFGTFFGADQKGPYIRSSFLHSTACDVPLGDGSGLLSVSGFDRTANVRMNGATGSTTLNWWPATATPWAGKVYLGLDGLPWSVTERGAFNGGIAEFRLYNHALTDVERAAIEVELASKYGLDTVETVGQSFDAAECAAHEKDALLFGRDPLGGPAAPVAMEWKDEVFHFAFGVEPAANERSLAFVGSDGAETSFVPRSAGSATEWIPRTWYVSSSAPSCGGVLEFSCDTSDADQFNYRLYRKGRTDSGYARLGLEPVIGDGKVTFALDDLSAGSYRFVRRLANVGMFIVIH